jgi:hypothetical protein
MQFRTWMLEGFANRFESRDVDEILSYGNKGGDYVRKGRYRSYSAGQLVTAGAMVGSVFLPGVGSVIGAGAGALIGKFTKGEVNTEKGVINDVLFTLKQLARKLTFGKNKTQFDDRFTEHDAANMRKNMTELYMLLALTGLALALKAMSDEDDEKKNAAVLNFLINQTTRLSTDITFYTNPLEAEKLMKSALPVLQLLTDVSKVFTDIFNLLDDNEDNDYYQSPSVFEGDLKLLIDAANTLPGTSQVVKMSRMVNKIY